MKMAVVKLITFHKLEDEFFLGGFSPEAFCLWEGVVLEERLGGVQRLILPTTFSEINLLMA